MNREAPEVFRNGRQTGRYAGCNYPAYFYFDRARSPFVQVCRPRVQIQGQSQKPAPFR